MTPTKMYNLSLCLILFFPLPLFIDSEIYETIHSNFRDASHFPKRRTPGENLFSLNICEVTSKQRRCKPQAPIKGGNFGAKFTDLCGLLSDASFLSRVKNNRTLFWLDVSFFVCFCFCFFCFCFCFVFCFVLFFSRVKTVVLYCDWLELICVANLRRSFLVSIYI